ncbi:MAG: ribonuclease D [Haliscomenobacter sp.]|nr:ribonuclease D [Haliscomenobacter sp.]
MTGYQLIEDQAGLEAFASRNKGIEWMCFDTEFVGEKRFFTRLCLMQVATRFGNYLIDPFLIPDLGPVLRMIQDPTIVKVTHAGENDYRLMFGLYGILPSNVFDTQIAAGFMGYKYPVSFKRLVESELRINLKKGYTVADWESRPFKASQLEYALEDVLPLHPLWEAQRENCAI